MNICLITMEWPPYGCGIGTYMFNLARGLNDFGHDVTVITHNRKPIKFGKVKIIQVPMPSMRRTLLRKIRRWRTEPYHTWSLGVNKALKSLRPDIIETAEFGALARHIVGNGSIPIVVKCHCPHRMLWQAGNCHSNGKLKPLPLWLSILDKHERRQTACADAIVSPSNALASVLSLIWQIPRSRFNVLANPIDTELFGPAEIDEKNKKEILYVGRFEYNKGIFDLAESASPILEKYPDLKIRFIGMDRKSPARLRSRGKTASEVIYSMLPKKLHDRIILTDHIAVSKIASFQQRAVCTVIPTRAFESFSYTVLEAMSCGSPVIATHCGGPSEIITDRKNGLLIPPGNPIELTAAIERLISNDKLRNDLSFHARETVEQRFSIPAVTPKIVRLYERVINQKKDETNG